MTISAVVLLAKTLTFDKNTHFMTDVWYAIGDFSYWVFKVMRSVNMNVNFLFMGLGVIFFLYWMWLQAKMNREAEQNGTFK